MKPVSVRDYLQTLYLLKLIQTASHDAARTETRSELRRWRMAQVDAQTRPWGDLLQRSIDLQAAVPATPGDLADWPLRLHKLPEPERSVLTLFYADLLPASTLCDLFKTDLPGLASWVTRGRQDLGFAAATGQQGGPSLPPAAALDCALGREMPQGTISPADQETSLVAHAERQRQFDEAISQALKAHRPDHAYLVDALSLVEPKPELTCPRTEPPSAAPAGQFGDSPDAPDAAASTGGAQPQHAGFAEPPQTALAAEADKEETAEEEGEEPRRHARLVTILIAIGVGFIGTVAIAWFIISEQIGTFAGAERVSELLDSANGLTGDEFEPVSTTAKDLEDYFFLKHGLEHYAVPKELADLPAVGCRVVKFEGIDVAEIMAVSPKEILLFLFPPQDLGVKIKPGRWEIIQAEHWVGGLNGDKDVCCLVSFQGTRDDMKAFLRAKRK